MTWLTFDAQDEAFNALAAQVSAILSRAREQRGTAHLVLSGGRTPAHYLPMLAAALGDWQGVSVSLSDERWVPVTHADSNEAMIRRHFLDLAPGATFAGMMGDSTDLTSDAAAADSAYRKLTWPADVTVLGAAPDGHVASLFPGQRSTQHDGYVIATSSPSGAPRLSLSAPALLSTRQVFIVTSGREKRDALQKAQQPGDANALPARLVLAQNTVPVTIMDVEG